MQSMTYNILVVEDNAGDVARAAARLAEAPFSLAISNVRSLADARQALAAGAIDAILLDLDLPDSIGVATLRAIVPLARVPIIVLSNLVDDRLRSLVTAAGAADVFAKQDAQSPLLALGVLYVLERERARDRHRRIAGLLDATPDAILVINHAGVVRYVNAAALGLFGCSREYLVGELLGFSIRDGEPLEIAIPRRDGERICEIRVVPFDWLGEAALLATIRDLTALKYSQREAIDKQRLAEQRAGQLHRVLDAIAGLATRCGLPEVGLATASVTSAPRDELEASDALAGALSLFESAFRGYVDSNRQLAAQNRQLIDAKAAIEAANRELEAFSASVAHDLRAPLRRISTFAHLLLEDHGKQLPERGTQYVGRILDGSDNMARLIDDLLALSRVAQAELRRAPVDLSRVARCVAARVLEGDPARQIELVIADDMVAEVDRNLAQIVLENLISNAYKFTSRRRLTRIEVGVLDRDPRVYFVRDNGAGFDPSYADHLFGVFRRLHSASEFEGTGIGLSIVKRAVERHGGKVWAEAAVDAGATFYFSLGPESSRLGLAAPPDRCLL